jgi:hypothetical protein
MTNQSPGLVQCQSAADRFQSAADILGHAWLGHYPIIQACQKFRRDCERLASNRGFSGITIAFVGPKKAGKSTIAGLLSDSKEKRQRLNAGQRAVESTAKPTWVASRPPDMLDSATEMFIPCHESELAPLGFDYAILDVPGSNEGNSARRELAVQALDSAVVKVLVVDQLQIESREIPSYLDSTAGAPIIPVINRIRPGAERSDLGAWEEKLRHTYPNVLQRVEIPDWDTEGELTKSPEDTRKELFERLIQAAAGYLPGTLAEPQLERKLLAFQNQVTRIAREHLPVTTLAVGGLHDCLLKMPEHAIEALLGDDRLVIARVRLRFRSILLEKTPIFLFPWRLTLWIANLVHGATDRLPLVLLGSVPSLVTTALTAARNTQEARQIAQDAMSGLRTRVDSVIRDMAAPQLRILDSALKRDLKLDQTSTPQTTITSSVNLRGLEALQTKSTSLFHQVIEKHAPGTFAAWLIAFLGFAIFWSVFAWPVYGLYQDFWLAALEVFERRTPALEAFPAGTLSMLLTSAALALLPMSLFLLCALALLTRKRRASRCASELKQMHKDEVRRMTETGQLELELAEPKIDACRILLRLSNPGMSTPPPRPEIGP